MCAAKTIAHDLELLAFTILHEEKKKSQHRNVTTTTEMMILFQPTGPHLFSQCEIRACVVKHKEINNPFHKPGSTNSESSSDLLVDLL